MTEEKLNAIEETLAHQEQQIQDLSDMVVTQGREMDTLRKEILKLQGKIENMDEGEQQPANQKPPHY